MLRFFFKVGVTLLAAGIIYHLTDLDLFWASIKSTDVKLLSIAILLFFPNQLLSAYRWYFILTRLREAIPFRTILYHSLVGQFSNLVLPGQIGGDVIRFLSISRSVEKKLPIILSVVIDKLALLLAIAIFALVGILAPGPVSHMTGVHLAAMVTIILVFPVVLVLCDYRNVAGHSRLVRFIGRLGFIRRHVIETLGDFSTLPSMRAAEVFSIMISALLLLLCYASGAYFVALSMHIHINPLDWIAINAIVSFVQIFPVTIGGLGVREGAFGVILSLYGIPFSQAIVFSLTAFILAAIMTALLWLTLDLIEAETMSTLKS